MSIKIDGESVLGWLAGLAALAAVAGCAQNGQIAGVQMGQIVGGGSKQLSLAAPVGNFLPSPGLLTAGNPGQPDLVYVNPAVNSASFNQVLLEPVAVLADPGSAISAIPRPQQQALANTFYSDLYQSLAQHCRMATSPAPGTLRIRVALIDAKATNPEITTVATYAPYLSTAYSAEAVAFNNGVGYFAGTATAEAYATDAATGSLVWQAVDRRGGTTAFVENTLDTWLDVHHAFTAWSNAITAKLQQFGTCQG